MALKRAHLAKKRRQLDEFLEEIKQFVTSRRPRQRFRDRASDSLRWCFDVLFEFADYRDLATREAEAKIPRLDYADRARTAMPKFCVLKARSSIRP